MAITILYPFPAPAQIRDSLTPIDLNNQVVTAGQLIKKPKGPWEGFEAALAHYGLVLSNGLSILGKEPPVHQKFFMKYLKGNTDPPRWTQQKIFNQRHRSMLVLMGWVRYLRDRGATKAWVHTELGVEDLSDVVRNCESPALLMAEFKLIDSRLDGPEKTRAYSEFKELPAAYALYPT
jgi:hypothetical protein